MNYRFSIATMLGFIAMSGFWLGAIRSSSPIWTSLAAVFTLAALLTGVLGLLITRGPARSFWMGFTLFGWVCLVMANGNWIGGLFGFDLTGGLNGAAQLVIPPVEIAQTPPSPPVAIVQPSPMDAPPLDPVAIIAYPPPSTIVQPPPAPPIAMPAPSFVGLPPAPPMYSIPSPADMAQMEIENERNTRITNFIQIGRMGLSLLFAMLGGQIGRWLATREEASRSNHPEPRSP